LKTTWASFGRCSSFSTRVCWAPPVCLKLTGGAGAQSRRRDPRAFWPTRCGHSFLRRTKDQVARELPSKNEQTVYCEMAPAQRQTLQRTPPALPGPAAEADRNRGLGKNPRSRCWRHCCACVKRPAIPGLIDPQAPGRKERQARRAHGRTARGHRGGGTKRWCSRSSRACSGSCENHLDAGGIAYEYLDGATRDRQGARGTLPERCRLPALPGQA